MAAGDYRFYLYGWGGVSGGTGHTVFQVSPSEKTNYEITWNAVWTGQKQGQTYAIANVTVLPSQIVFINFQFDGGESPPPMLISGLQIVAVPAPGALGASMWGALSFGMRRRREQWGAVVAVMPRTFASAC